MPASFRSDRSWTFDVGADELWDRISSTGRYREWWPWLRTFDGGAGMVEGESWDCVVAPPLPYLVRFRVVLDRVETGSEIASHVTGDIGGTARLTIGADDGRSTTTARLVSDLHPRNQLLRSFGVVARPLVEYGHNWVLDQGRRQFAERAFD